MHAADDTQALPVIHEVFPYLRVHDAEAALAYYRQVFGANVRLRLDEKGTGRIGHAELVLGTAVIMVSDEYPECGILGPRSVGGASVTLHLHVDNADRLLARAVAAGGTLVRPPADAFYGERGGMVRDPFGHEWLIGHTIEEVSAEEMQRRYDELMAGA
ncbi:VOC family protein [Dyella sp. BiH032]|uniref:VOC family protein n=1 Tax=Dyella sp. BiH032 TaxID=3075430 RepID=UPI0028929B89|nr:VOC family protein [Dyella sp. BiH032]WNL44848.1 VOC family protein [Dyella sp. BiH032]